MEMPRKVAPRGLPSCFIWAAGALAPSPLMEVLRRKSWVTAMPMAAKAREVRSQARKVRSVAPKGGGGGGEKGVCLGRREGGGNMDGWDGGMR